MYDENEDSDAITYKVLVNGEEQYSLWPTDDDIPQGWRDAGKTGPKNACLDYIEKVWTDMRPKSLRKTMVEESQTRQPVSYEIVNERTDGDSCNADGKQDVVAFLSRGEHPVTAGVGSGLDAKAFKESIEKGFVYVTFTDTAGGTELGVKLDRNELDTGGADFRARTGNVHIVGDLALNWQKARCIATIDIATLKGLGHLQIDAD